MFVLLLCFPCAALQVGGLELPKGLATEASAVQAWTELQDPQTETQQRIAASRLLLESLAPLPAVEQLPFLLEVDGLGLWAADLRPVYRALAADWEPLEARLLETLVLPAGQNDAMLRGAIHATGTLATSNPELLEQLAVLLQTPSLASAARSALENLCGREFGNQEAFQNWWAQAKAQSREAWLEQAHEEENAREVEDWRRRLNAGGEPLEILLGIVHPRQVVRAMAYDALRQLNLESLDQATQNQVANALRNALQQESDAALRIELLALVPQVLQGREALNPLLRALEFGIAAEREAAAGYLQLLQPLDVAWEGLLRGLGGVYPASTAEPQGNVAVRMALWSGLGTLAVRGPAPDAAALETRMQEALAAENDRAVRDHILSAIGRLGGPSCFQVLQPLVMDAEEPQADRSDALIAMRGIAERSGDHALLEELLPGLLADGQPQVRRQAIESLRKLHLPNAPQMLVQRLSAETEVVLQKALLAALAEQESPGVLDLLARFEPGPALREAYGKALVVQIGSKVESLDYVYAKLLQRYDREFAFLVMRKFPRENLSVANLNHVERTYAVAVCEHLLMVGVENGNASYAEDAITRLHDLGAAEPQELLWPTYRVELQLMRGEVEDAVAVMIGLAAQEKLSLARKWELGLDALRFAVAANDLEQGRVLLGVLDGAGPVPEEMRFAYDQVRAHFPSVAPESVSAPPKGGSEEPVDAPGEGSSAVPPSDVPKMVSDTL